jgi:hypothetical protein
MLCSFMAYPSLGVRTEANKMKSQRSFIAKYDQG